VEVRLDLSRSGSILYNRTKKYCPVRAVYAADRQGIYCGVLSRGTVLLEVQE
jgi:hypothetical protein